MMTVTVNKMIKILQQIDERDRDLSNYLFHQRWGDDRHKSKKYLVVLVKKKETSNS